MKSSNVKRMVLSAVMIGLATVLSLVKIWKMPLGGSITLLSMLPIVLISIKYGVKWGMFTSLIYAVMQIFVDLGEIMTWGLTVKLWIGSIVFDYLIAYGILGISGIFRKKGIAGMCSGVALALFMRFASHVVSGTIFFDIWCPEGWNPFVYSLAYNGGYMLPELVFTMAAVIVITKVKVMNKLIDSDF